MSPNEAGSSSWDAIVIGSGIGGLVCAGYLAAFGRRVLVLEQHDVAGGNCHMFRRRRSYEFDIGVHYLGDCGPGGLLPSLLAGLGVGDRVRFRRLDPDGFDRIVLPGLRFDVPESWSRYGDRLLETFPAEAAGLREYLAICGEIAAAARYSASSRPVLGNSAAVVRWSRRGLSRLFDHCGLSVAARTVLAAQSGNYASSPANTVVAAHIRMLDDYLTGGAYYPEGGGQMLAAALVEQLETHGGQLRTKARAARILIEHGRVAGVELADGEILRAPLVVSNADYRRTVLELCGGRENLPEGIVRRTEDAVMRLPLVTSYAVVDTELPEASEANIWYWPSGDVESAYSRTEAGQFDELPFVFISSASHKDPGNPAVCPPGYTNLQIMTACPPGYEQWGVTDGPASGLRYRRVAEYRAAKEKLAACLLDRAEEVLGPFRDRIVYLESATPLTQERYTLATGGAAYGLQSWGPHGRRPDVRTAVEGLFVAGQDIHGGGVVGAAVGGAQCAEAILDRPVLAEAYDGAVFADRALLPERGHDWDPLRISRGQARRDARGFAPMAR
ncbi:phytoene desaturase family protein [Amycolatopsis sp. cg13]|uniref:phytoene desaturase family protein n=1 Tax=Amycolatopsis sp. cg13 TaxID=3238807 RepID=UPI0035240EB8